MRSNPSGNQVNIDISQEKVYKIAYPGNSKSGGIESINVGNEKSQIEIDPEVINLLSWLAEKQEVNEAIALKKAVIMAAYFQDLVYNQKGKLLLRRPDNTVAEIVLK